MEVLNANDAVSARKAECYVTLNGKRYNYMMLINFEAKVDKTKAKVPRLGSTMIGHKTVAMEGTFSGKAHYNQSELRKALKEFKETGVDPTFEIQVVNDDNSSAAGSQEVFLYGCSTDGGTLTKFDADAEYLDEDINGTFDDWSLSKEFKHLPGFEV